MGSTVLAVINEEIGLWSLWSSILAGVCMRRPLRHSLFLLATARAVEAGGKRLSLSAFHRFRENKNKNLDIKKGK
jgi:hypothetical protein